LFSKDENCPNRNVKEKRGEGVVPEVISMWEDRITVDPAVLVGKPVIKGTRLSVEFVVGLLAQGWSEAEVLRNYPGIAREDVLACLAYAQDRLKDERVYPVGA
jgi:uncharacterized protein (DUF433 family)